MLGCNKGEHIGYNEASYHNLFNQQMHQTMWFVLLDVLLQSDAQAGICWLLLCSLITGWLCICSVVILHMTLHKQSTCCIVLLPHRSRVNNLWNKVKVFCGVFWLKEEKKLKSLNLILSDVQHCFVRILKYSMS